MQELLANTFLILANERRLRSDLTPEEIERVTKESGLNDTQLRTATLRALANASAKVFQGSHAFYAPLQSALTSPMSDASKREFAWQRHNSYVQGLFHRTPIVSLNTNEQMPLSHIYIPPRGYWHDEIVTIDDDTGEELRNQVTFVRDLTDTLAMWSSSTDVARDEKLKVIMGGPGSGKSSFARSFASKLVVEGNSRVVYVNLQHMKLRADLQTSIENHLRDMHSWADLATDQGLPESPFNWAKADSTPIFFFFDGLDELTARDDETQTIAQAFLQDLQGLISKYDGQINMRAVVLGRNAACQEAARRIRLKRSNLLHVAPLTPIEDDIGTRHRNQLTSEFNSKIDGNEEILNTDQRLEFWKRWVSLKDGNDKAPKIFGEKALEELTSEPLFLLLLILTGFVEGAWEKAAKNKNIVYKDILEKIYDRNQAKNHQASSGIEKVDFYKLMETIGLATWHGNGRTGTEEDFVRLRVLYLGADEDERLAALPGSDLKNVALQIHARKREEARSGFEFIHKSFGEYLSGKAILKFAIDLVSQDRQPVQEKAVYWAKMTAQSEMDANLASFLQNEAKELSDSAALELRVKLEKIARWIVMNGAPVHQLEGAGIESLRTYERKDANSSKLLTFLISELADRHPDSRPNFAKNSDRAVNYFETADYDVRKFIRSIVGISSAASPASFKWANLRGCNFVHTTFQHSNFKHADFVDASLQGTMFNFANMKFSNFERAAMSHASFYDVEFAGSRFVDAHCQYSIFDEADFAGADLTEAGLAMSCFRGANLREAIGLTQSQVDSIIGDSRTELPPGLARPSHWLDRKSRKN